MISLWVEGYSISGNRSDASFCGKYDVDTLQEAVIEYKSTVTDQRSRDLIDVNKLTYWGCRFFDNEDDARRSFG